MRRQLVPLRSMGPRLAAGVAVVPPQAATSATSEQTASRTRAKGRRRARPGLVADGMRLLQVASRAATASRLRDECYPRAPRHVHTICCIVRTEWFGITESS